MTAAAKWDSMPCLAFDTETSGVDPLEARIVTVALVEVTPGRGRPVLHRWLANPGIEIPDEAAAIHGITTAHARQHGQPVDQVLFEVAAYLAPWLGHGKPVVAMNAAYDFTIFEAECRRHHVDGLVARLDHPAKVAPVIDPFVLDKYADPYRRGGRELEQMCATYGVRHTGAHDAAGDALAAARLWPRIIAAHARKFQGQTLGGLHAAQVGWRRDQCNSLRTYFDKNRIEHDGVDVGWPFHTALTSTVGARS